MAANKTVLENIKAHYEEMFSAEKKVADFILGNPERAVMMNVSELSQESGVSDATVIRMCKRIECEGYYQMKILLSNDLGKNHLIKYTDGNSKPSSLGDLFQVFARNMVKLAEGLDMKAMKAAVDLIKKANVVHVVAAGNTTPIALDLGFRLGRFGIKASYSMINEYYLNNLGLADEKDVLIAISHSGSSKQVMQAVELAKRQKLKCVAITGYERSPISNMADHLLLAKFDTPIFGDSMPDSHLPEMAVVDALLYFLVNEKAVNEGIDTVELMLSEYKI
jgi:RpiR family transcriptional regulator, carbohydrate utilization regulator